MIPILQVDGWTDLINRSILNFIVNTPRPVFVEFLDTKAEHHTWRDRLNISRIPELQKQDKDICKNISMENAEQSDSNSMVGDYSS